MSRDIFQDLEDIFEVQDRDIYVPGVYDPAAYSAAIHCALNPISSNLEKSVEQYTRALSHYSINDADSFIEGIISQISHMDEKYDAKYFLDGLIQYFYNQGHNDFHVDLTPLCRPYSRLLNNLKGTPDRPLKASVEAFALIFGYHVENCELVLDGDASYVGCSAVYSKIQTRGRPVRCGHFSEGCEFTTRSTKSIPCDAVPKDTVYRVEFATSERHLSSLQQSGFFSEKRNNKILIRHEDGSWREVKP